MNILDIAVEYLDNQNEYIRSLSHSGISRYWS